MKYEKFDSVDLANGNSYIIIDIVEVNEKKYFYLINESDERDDEAIVRLDIENGVESLNSITDKEEQTKVLQALYNLNKDFIEELIEE